MTDNITTEQRQNWLAEIDFQLTLHRLEKSGQTTVEIHIEDVEFLLDETKRLAKDKEDCGRYITEKLDKAIAGGVKRLGELKERVRLLESFAVDLVSEKDPEDRNYYCSVCGHGIGQKHSPTMPCAILNHPEE